MILNVCAGMPSEIANIISKIINIIKIVVPVGLVIFGMLDFAKATWAQKDEEIAKGKNTFFKRLISGALVFFVIAIVQLVFNLLDTNGSNEAISCLNSILNGTGGSSYGGGSSSGSGGDKTTTLAACNYRGSSTCSQDGKCKYCGNISKCVEIDEDCNKLTTTTTYHYQIVCKHYEDSYGVNSDLYERCKECSIDGKYDDSERIHRCVSAGGYENIKSDCSKKYGNNNENYKNCLEFVGTKYYNVSS